MNFKRKMLRFFPVFTIMLAILFLTSITAKAETMKGNCGKDDAVVTWMYDDESKTLTISGNGAMGNYNPDNQAPWYDDFNTDIHNVVIADGVTSIGSYAFYYCSNLMSVTIPNGVTSIGNDAFHFCNRLTNVTIPDSVTSIGSYAFYYCPSLTSVTIPNGVTSIGSYVFYKCTGLASVTIPDSVTSIGSYAFGYTGLTSVTIPDSVTSIGSYAFYYCPSLTSVIIPSSETEIGEYAFGYYFIDGDNDTYPNFTIYGKANSKAQEYAVDYKITFQAVTFVPIPLPLDFYYDGAKHIGVSAGTGYTVLGDEKTDAGTYHVTAILKDGYCWKDGTVENKALTWKILVADISSATITLPDQTYTYNGSAFTPEPTVKIGNATLAKDKDYTVTYSNNTNAGTATVTITGKGNYNGTKETTFVINPAPNSDAKETDAKDPTKTDDSTNSGAKDPTKTDDSTKPGTDDPTKADDFTNSGTENTTESVDPTKPGASVEDTERFITGLTNDNDPAGTDYQTLQAKASKVTKSSVKLSWKRVSGAKGYIIYGNKCGKKNKYKKIKTVTKTSYTQKKLKKGTYYKYLVVAYDKDNKVLTTSKTIYAATTGGKYDTAKSVTTKAKKDKVTVKVNKTFNLKAKAVASSKKGKMEKHRAIQYESTNTNIATVNAKGVITGKAKGTCYVYVYAMNGVSKKIKVTVK